MTSSGLDRPRMKSLSGLVIFSFLAAIALFSPRNSLAKETAQGGATPNPQVAVPMSDEECLACHSTPDMILPLPNGEELYLTVDSVSVKTSVHGRLGYACVQCHTDISGFPHPEFEAQSLRDVTLQMAGICAQCHQEESELYQLGDHAQSIAAGNKEAAVCTDCHGFHKLEEFGGSRSKIALTCRNCHSDIYDVYKESVHGAALLEDFDPFVPTCVDCHSNHFNRGPEQQPDFHLFSPQLCAKCHADEELMTRYGVNTNVFDTYIADFHGTTVAIFEKIAPDQETNKPVCIDCHSVHDIRSSEDEESTVIKHNLLDTCQRCHPDATANFPDSWLSHYPPDPQNNTIVFLVNLFYSVFIPATLGGMLIFISTDAWRRFSRKDERRGEKGEAQ